MRTSILLAATLFTTAALAQIPNGAFDDWTTDQPYGDPLSWITSNSFATTFGTLPTCERGEPGSDGFAFAKVINRANSGGVVLPGTIVSGALNKYGFPYDQRPDKLEGKCMYTLSQYDMAQVKVILTKWDAVGNHSYTVGSGLKNFNDTANAWEDFSIFISYGYEVMPDTAIITITAGASPLLIMDGSFIQVDELKFGESGMGMEETAGTEGFTLWPSVATERVHMASDRPLQEASIYDATGRLAARSTVNGLQATVQVAALAPGRYILEARCLDGTRMRQHFIKE
jgi:hypothetical protein